MNVHVDPARGRLVVGMCEQSTANTSEQILMSSGAEPGFQQREHGLRTFWINETLLTMAERRAIREGRPRNSLVRTERVEAAHPDGGAAGAGPLVGLPAALMVPRPVFVPAPAIRAIAVHALADADADGGQVAPRPPPPDRGPLGACRFYLNSMDFSAVPVHPGDLLDALLSPGVMVEGAWVHGFRGSGGRAGFNALTKKSGGVMRVGQLRERLPGGKARFMPSHGLVSLAQHEGGARYFMYANLGDLSAWLDVYSWFLSNAERNRVMHALNGNGKTGSAGSRSPASGSGSSKAGGKRDKKDDDPGTECKCTECTRPYLADRELMKKQKGAKVGLCSSCHRALKDASNMMPAAKAKGKSSKDLDDAQSDDDDPPAGGWANAQPSEIVKPKDVHEAAAELVKKHLAPGYGYTGSHVIGDALGEVVCIFGCYKNRDEVRRLKSQCSSLFLIIPDLVEPEESLPGMTYTRVGTSFQDVLIEGVVYRDMDMVFTAEPIEINFELFEWCLVDSVVLNGSLVNVRLYKLIISSGCLNLANAPRGTHFRDGENTFSSWRGPNKTVLRMGMDQACVSTSIFRETGRFYLPSHTPEVCTSHVLGSLKNNNELDQIQIALLVAYHAARLRTTGTKFLRAQTSGAGERRRHRDITAGCEQRTVWPSCVDCFFDPYQDATRYARLLFFWALCVLALALGVWYSVEIAKLARLLGSAGFARLEEAGGILAGKMANAPEILVDAAFAGAESMANATFRGAEHIANATAKVKAAFNEATIIPDEGHKWYDYLIAGVLEQHVRHVYLGDLAAGWKARAAVLWAGTLKSNLIDLLFSLCSVRALFAVGVFPLVEELARRISWVVVSRDLTVPYLRRTFHFELSFGFLVTLALALVEGLVIAATVGLDAGLLRVLLHLVLKRLGLRWAVFWHTAHNLSTHVPFIAARLGGPAAIPLQTLSASAALIIVGFDAYKKRQENKRFRILPAMFPDSQFLSLFQAGAEDFPLKDDSKIKCRGRRDMKPGNELVQVMAEFAPFRSFAKSVSNILHSLHGRVCKWTIQCEDTRVHEQVGASLSTKLGSVEPDSFEDWVRHFPPGKQARYRLAHERYSILGDAVLDDTILGSRNKWRHLKAFLKHEPNLVQPGKVSRGFKIACSDPRTIQATEDVLQVVFGPWAAAMGRRESEVLDGSENSKVLGVRVLVAYGMTKKQVGKKIRAMCETGDKCVVDCGDDVFLIWGRRVYAIDASRWDAHVGMPLLKLRIQDNIRMGMPRKLALKVHEIDSRSGSFQGAGVSYEAVGGVSSGRWDTLQANTKDGVKICVGALISCKTWEEFVAYASRVGIVYELAAEASRGVYDTRLDFCSSVFAPTADGYTLVPKVGKALAKMCYTMHGNVPELAASKIGALTYELAPFPEIVKPLREMLADLPKCGPTAISYFPAGSAEPAELGMRVEFFANRYGVAYQELCEEVQDWVDRSRQGVLEGGDLVLMRRLVEVDFGKKPEVCAGAPAWRDNSKPAESWGKFVWRASPVLLIAALSVVVGLCALGCSSTAAWSSTAVWGSSPGNRTINFGSVSHAHGVGGWVVKDLRKGADYLSNLTNMSNKGKQNRRQQPQQPKRKQKQQQQKGKIKGSGSYAVPIAALAARVAKMIPKGTFENVGKNVGGRLGRGLAGITGVGDYVVNDIVNPSAPRKGGAHVQTISNVEYVKDIVATGNTGFNLSEYAVNAANPALFPWLNSVARLYTKYRFKQLLFEFRSTSSEYAATVGLGSIVMAPQYNIDASTFTTKQQMEAATNAVSFKPSLNSMCGVECSPDDSSLKWYMIRDPSATPTMFTDPLSFAIAINGSSAGGGVGLGELWVHYTVDLLEPILAKADMAINGEAAVLTNYSLTAGAINNGTFGWKGVTPGDLGVNIYTTSNIKVVFRNVPLLGVPTGIDWDICYDTSSGTRFYFNRPAIYTFSVTEKFTTAPTTTNTGNVGLWEPNNGTTDGCSVFDMNNCFSADRTLINDVFSVNTTKYNASCDIQQQLGWTTTASVIDGSGVNAPGCKVCISAIPYGS